MDAALSAWQFCLSDGGPTTRLLSENGVVLKPFAETDYSQ